MFVKQMPITIRERTGETDPSLALRMTGEMLSFQARHPVILSDSEGSSPAGLAGCRKKMLRRTLWCLLSMTGEKMSS